MAVSAPDASSSPIESIDQLVEHFARGIKAPANRRVGSEHEKFIFDADTLAAAPYEGPRGIGAILAEMADQFGYEKHLDMGKIIALERQTPAGTEAISLEPGGQLELGGAPLVHLDDVRDELDRHLSEVRQIIEPKGLIAIGTGFDALHDLGDVPWMPKSRYAIMREYMPKVGSMGQWMMKMTCTVQANLDFTSEDDAVDMLTTALQISPIISALFAHSPLWNGAPSGFMTTRCHIWTDTDRARTGFPPFLLQGDYGFWDYVQYTLDVPMYFIERDHRYIDLSGHSFRDFLNNGHDGYRATMADFELHLSTVFTEVRMKRYIEVRGADMGSRAHVLALPAIWKGILYDAQSRREARALTNDFSVEERARLFEQARRSSLAAPISGANGAVTLREMAGELVQFAAAGLERLESAPSASATHMAGANEARYLEPLIEATLEGGVSASQRLLSRWKELDGDTAEWMREQRIA